MQRKHSNKKSEVNREIDEVEDRVWQKDEKEKRKRREEEI